MKNYVIALISFPEDEIKQFKISAENEYDALKLALIEFEPDEKKQDEIQRQKSEYFPKDMDDFFYYMQNIDMSFSIINL